MARDRAVAVIRALGFVGNAHYCAGCLNEFHADRGQHKPGCSVLADVVADVGWWDGLTVARAEWDRMAPEEQDALIASGWHP